MYTTLNRARVFIPMEMEIAGPAALLRRGGFLPSPSRRQASSEARSIVHHSHTGRSAWGNAPQASDIPLALGGVCGAFQRHSPPCSPRLTDRANARRGRVSLRRRDRIRRARGSRAWAAAKSTLARRRRPARVPTGTEVRTLESVRGTKARPSPRASVRPRQHCGNGRTSRLCCARVCGGEWSGRVCRDLPDEGAIASWPFYFRRRAPPPHRRRTEACQISALLYARPSAHACGGRRRCGALVCTLGCTVLNTTPRRPFRRSSPSSPPCARASLPCRSAPARGRPLRLRPHCGML